MGFRHNFLIGLGGTGGAALKAFREIAVERSAEHDALVAAGRRFEYLYIDSNAVDVDNAARWEHHGQHIGLVQGIETIHLNRLKAANSKSLLKLPNVIPWLGENGEEAIEKVLESPYIQGAGQRRRYGRVLAAIHADEIKERLCTGICSLASGSTDHREVTFHVFASLGGGTGSGCLVDVLTLLPQLCRDFNIQCKIVAYLFVGDAAVRCSAASFFFKNEYAALRDINALMSNRYRPFRALEPRIWKAPFHDTADPIHAVYISTEEYEVRLEAQVKRFAASCYDLISYVPGAASRAGRAFSGEDLYWNNPGEVSEVVEDPHIRGKIVVQSPPRNDGRQLVSTVDRSYRFQTLSGVRARHPKEELHGILTAELGKKVLERWLAGELSNRDTRDTSLVGNEDIYAYGKNAAFLIRSLDEEYRHQQSGNLQSMLDSYAKQGRSLATFTEICQESTDHVRRIQEQVAVEVKDPAVESICRKQAEADCSAIISALESRRRWGAGEDKPSREIWGIKDILEYLHKLSHHLEAKIAEYRMPECSEVCEGMQRLYRERVGLGFIKSRFTLAPRKLHRMLLAESSSCLELGCDARLSAFLHLRDKFLLHMLKEHIRAYTNSVSELQGLQQVLQTQQRGYLERLSRADVSRECPELHVTDTAVYVWNDKTLEEHLGFYRDDARCDAAVSRAVAACDRVVQFAYNFGRNAVGSSCTEGAALLENLLQKGTGILWQESDVIHEELCNRVGPKQYPRAYAQTIYHYLAEKGDSFRHSLTDLLMVKMAPSAVVAVHGYPTCGEIQPGPWQASCLGMSDCAMLSDAAAAAHADMRNRLLTVLQGKASGDVRLEAYGHGDPFEIRLCHTQYFMPLRFFRVMAVLEESYKRGMELGNPESLFFPNIDDAGMLDPSPDRPDLLPELDPIKHTAREELRKQLQEKNTINQAEFLARETGARW